MQGLPIGLNQKKTRIDPARTASLLHQVRQSGITHVLSIFVSSKQEFSQSKST
jgi:hypothetical protein